MFIMLVIKCVPQQTYTTTSWKQRINMCHSVCQIGWDCYKHGNRHPKGVEMFIMLVIKCASQQTYTTTHWKQRINMCYSVCQIGWDCYKHGNRHSKGFKCSSCWPLNVLCNRHTPLLPGNNESTCVTAFVRLAGTVISMAIVIQGGSNVHHAGH